MQGGPDSKNALDLFDIERDQIETGQNGPEKTLARMLDADKLCVRYADSVVDLFPLRLIPAEEIQWLDVALGAARRLKDSVNECRTLGNLGVAHSASENYRAAIKFHEAQLRLAREIREHSCEPSALHNLGIAHYRLSEYELVMKFHEEALRS